jgi:hypothetical protein
MAFDGLSMLVNVDTTVVVEDGRCLLEPSGLVTPGRSSAAGARWHRPRRVPYSSAPASSRLIGPVNASLDSRA